MRRITASRTAAGNRRGEGRPRLRWARAGAPPSSKRRFSRRTRRTLIPRATATCPFVTRPAQAALSNPGRCSSFRLNVKVSMGGGLFHVAVRGGHFHVAAANSRPGVDALPVSVYLLGHGRLAQLAERWPHMPEVTGSSPVSSTIYNDNVLI